MPSDEDAISAIVYGYAELLDSGDLEGVARLFAHATLRSDAQPGARRGAAEVLELYRSTVALYDGIPCTKHVITNLVVDIDGERSAATARSYYTVLQARPELPLQIVIAGRYHDRFARIDGVWQFTDRLIFVDLVGDLRFHLRYTLWSR